MPRSTENINLRHMVGASNKAFDYMACGLPLLVTDLPEWVTAFVEPGYARACNPDDPDSIEHESIRHFREMADAIHADRVALAGVMGAARTEIPDVVDDIKVPVLVVTGDADVHAGPPAPLAERLANGTAVLTAGDHPGVKDQPDAHRAIVEFLASV